jgi:hypothetical protein
MLKESSCSTKYNTEDMDSEERNNIRIPELGCTMGQAWGSLKKSWQQLKYCLKIGDYERVEILKERISNIRAAMGLENQEIW